MYIYSKMDKWVLIRLVDVDIAYVYSVVEEWAIGWLVDGCLVGLDHGDNMSGKGKRQSKQKDWKKWYIFYLNFMKKTMVEPLIENIVAAEIIAPPGICAVINTSYPQP